MSILNTKLNNKLNNRLNPKFTNKLNTEPYTEFSAEADKQLQLHSQSPLNNPPKVHAMIVAAGRGSRFGAAVAKQYLLINEQTLLQLSVARLASSAYITHCLLVIAADDTTAHTLNFELPVSYAQGGAERWQSVSSGMQAIAQSGAADDDLVVIHDAARPAVTTADIERVISAAMTEPYGAILATPVADTLKQAQHQPSDHNLLSMQKPDPDLEAMSNNQRYYSQRTIDRSTIWQAQTPQVFRLGKLRQVLSYVANQQLKITDEASAFEQLNFPIRLVAGSRQNIKLTYPDDALLLSALLTAQGQPSS